MTTPVQNASQLPFFHVVGFSGHRMLSDTAGAAQAITDALQELRRVTPGEWIAQSSVAAGSDQLFVHSAFAAGMGWEALLPLPLIDFERDFTPEEWKGVKALLDRAEHMSVVPEPGTRDEAYLSGGFEIVNNCDVLLVVWDGQPARGKGGTADVVNYARAMQRPIIIINPTTLAVRREFFEKLQLNDANLRDLNALPEGKLAPPEAGTRAQVAAFQRKVDRAAVHHAPQFRRLIALTVWLLVGVTALSAVRAYGWQGAEWPWGNLFMLVGAFVVTLFLRYHRTKQHWTRCRLAAEITRSALAIWGLSRATRLFADFDWPGLEPLRRSLDVLHRRAAREYPTDFDTFKQVYLCNRIDDQLIYFAEQAALARPKLVRLRTGYIGSISSAIILTALSAWHEAPVYDRLSPGLQQLLFGYLPIVLPFMAAAFFALISVNDLHRRVARCRVMAIRLELARREIAYSQTWAGLERAIVKAERALIEEVLEWHSITSFA